MPNTKPKWEEEFREWIKLWRPFFYQEQPTTEDMDEITAHIRTLLTEVIEEAGKFELPFDVTINDDFVKLMAWKTQELSDKYLK